MHLCIHSFLSGLIVSSARHEINDAHVQFGGALRNEEREDPPRRYGLSLK